MRQSLASLRWPGFFLSLSARSVQTSAGLLEAALALGLQVYRHHCVGQLSEKHRRMRDCALYIAGNVNATKWALELYGFRDVAIPIQAMQMSDSVDGTVSPVLLNVRLSIRLSL